MRQLAASFEPRAYAPFSETPAAAVLLLSDGQYIPGVRVENVTFPLLIPAVLNAYTTAVALERTDIVALVTSRPVGVFEKLVLGGFGLDLAERDAYTLAQPGALPEPTQPVSPFLGGPKAVSVDGGLRQADEIAHRAYVPNSDFPVGAILETAAGAIPGVNVEHPEWLFGLCAERNALGTARSYGITEFNQMFLTCPKDPTGTPCGACRQVLVEHDPDLPIYIYRGDDLPPDLVRPSSLLPGAFDAAVLRGRRA
ncbi:MAG: cytidine deaminase [Bacteroidota bacterium]